MFITFEGIEGCGKSTQAALLYKKLMKEHIPTLLTYEPGDTPLGQKLRSLVLSEPMDAVTELLLFLADRREHIRQVILPALAQSKLVISDRFFHSTIAYQVYGRGMNPFFVHTLHETVLDGVNPDRVYLLDIDISIAFQRKKKHTLDRIEQETMDFHERVRKGFLEISKQDASCLVLDATLSPEALHEIIWDDLARLLHKGDKHAVSI